MVQSIRQAIGTIALLFILFFSSSISNKTSAFSSYLQHFNGIKRNIPKHQRSSSLSLNMSSPSSTPDIRDTSSSNHQQDMDKAKSLISKAISIGAPAYNAGDIPECARVYKETAMEIVSLLPQNLLNGLQSTIATEYENANDEAWALRIQFDSVMEYEIPFMPQLDEALSNATDEDTFTFEKFTEKIIPAQPLIVNDNVMGGMSQCQWISNKNTFRGNTSLANNGGFASLRWRMGTTQNWSYAKGIYLKVKHSNPDEHTFRIILKDTTCEQVRGANFKNVFSNPTQTSNAPILIPFEAFGQMEQMGRALSGPVFNRGAVTEVGIMAIKPTVVGEFELEIVEWGLYS